MDKRYASQKLIAKINQQSKIYSCPLRGDRLVDDKGGIEPSQRLDQLTWCDSALIQGKLIKMRGLPKDKKLNLFLVTVSTARTEERRHQQFTSTLIGCDTKPYCLLTACLDSPENERLSDASNFLSAQVSDAVELFDSTA